VLEQAQSSNREPAHLQTHSAASMPSHSAVHGGYLALRHHLCASLLATAQAPVAGGSCTGVWSTIFDLGYKICVTHIHLCCSTNCASLSGAFSVQ
jgi:hypothetical protein